MSIDKLHQMPSNTGHRKFSNQLTRKSNREVRNFSNENFLTRGCFFELVGLAKVIIGLHLLMVVTETVSYVFS